MELLKFHNGVKKKNVHIKHILLDNTQQLIVDNGIVAGHLPLMIRIQKKYTYYDKKYDEIKVAFDLLIPQNIIWLKFTTDGYLGVVASSFDINFSYESTSGKLIDSVGKKWDETFVLIFPLTNDILLERNKTDIETAVGN